MRCSLTLLTGVRVGLGTAEGCTVCAALVACSKLVSAETIPALLNSVLELLPHPKESVRKKAVLCLHWYVCERMADSFRIRFWMFDA